MPSPLTIRPPRNAGEATAYAFHVLHHLAPVAQPTLDRAEGFVQRTGAARMRLAFRRGEVVGGLVLLPMGQFFGGRSVSMTGVSAVVVPPEHRSGGIARALLAAALREMAARGEAVSTLFPATQPVYRRMGWEAAFTRRQWEVPTRALAIGAKEPRVRPMVAADRAAVHACWHEWARLRPGSLDRIDWTWRRVLESADEEVRAHVVDGRGGLEGYVVATRTPAPSGHPTVLDVRDLVALTPRALRRLVTFLGDHRSVAPTTLLRLPPGEAAWLLPAEHELRLTSDQRFMLRIVDAAEALRQRGYPPGLRAELTLQVEDDVLTPRRRVITLRCACGRGAVEPGRSRARVAVRADARGLAAAFTGHLSAEQAALAGLMDGDAAALSALSACFAGPAPFTSDTW